MVMPNIGAFVAWGLITALFIATGWLPNEKLSTLVGPMLSYLLPLLVAYTAGKNIHGQRGAVIACVASIGLIVGSDIPMFLGIMMYAPLAGWVLKKFDAAIEGKVEAGFEMLVDNFSIGIIGTILAILGYYLVGPFVAAITAFLTGGANIIYKAGLLPLISIFVEPAKILFLNNAINHGIMGPIGVAQAADIGKSIMFLVETNPGPGMGIILADGANAMAVSDAVAAKLAEMKPFFPNQIEYFVSSDSTPFVRASIHEVVSALGEAMVLVVIVMFIFLQNLRATLIPAIAVPVVLLGTFGVLSIAGYSINTLTMFAMVLAIGLLVDDAIVVVVC